MTFARRACIVLSLVVAQGCGGSESAPAKPAADAKPTPAMPAADTKPAAALPTADAKPAAAVPAADAKSAAKDPLAAAKDAGSKLSGPIGPAVDALDTFAKSLTTTASGPGAPLAQAVKAKLPELQGLVDKVKTQLSAGGAEGKALATQLDEKLATLNTKLDTLTKSAATATQQMKDEAVTAFKDLVAQLKTAVTKK